MGKILRQTTPLLITVAMALCSCSTDGCIDNQSSIPLAGFYSAETQQQIALNSIEVWGVGATGDSLLTTTGTATQQVYLPFRATQNNTTFCFHYSDYGASAAYNDTVWFDYEATPYFASEECGAMYRYRITNVRHTNISIDSIEVIDPEITNTDVERIKIFFITE